MPAKYRIHLSAEEQQKLKTMVQVDKIAKYKRTHAQMLLAPDENGTFLIEEGLDTAVESQLSRHGCTR